MPEKKRRIVIPVPKERRMEGYWKLLNNVIDPEAGVGIVDLGLIYDVDIKAGVANVIMTLTSTGCPAGPEIMRRIEAEMGQYPGVKDVTVELVWEPIWGPDMIDDSVRGMFFGE